MEINNFRGIFKRRILILTVMISFILGTIAAWAQIMVIPVFDWQSLILKQNTFLPMGLLQFENNQMDPLQKELKEYYAFEFYSESRPVSAKIKQMKTVNTPDIFLNREVFKAAYNNPRVDEKELLRQNWEEAFGVDVWYPYYKYKEIEGAVKEKLSIKVLKFKGEPFFEKNKVLYVLKTNF
jgi:hypothetical protein